MIATENLKESGILELGKKFNCWNKEVHTVVGWCEINNGKIDKIVSPTIDFNLLIISTMDYYCDVNELDITTVSDGSIFVIMQDTDGALLAVCANTFDFYYHINEEVK